MKYLEWLNKANSNINETLVACFNNHHLDGWSENHITTQVMESIESLGLEIDWTDRPQKLKWEGFKLKGKAESSFGDIVVIVKVWITSDRFVNGVAFYEAKRQFFDDKWKPKGFSSIKSQQLSNISSKTHASNVLLYDVDIEEQRACASSVPTAFVNELAQENIASKLGRTLHLYGDFWVKSLGDNFLGKQLDFQKKSVDEIERLINGTDRPLIILNAAVTKTQMLEPKLENSFIDKNLYDRWLQSHESESIAKIDHRSDGPNNPSM